MAPRQLEEIQRWFGSIISRPLSEEQTSLQITPKGNFLSQEAPLFVTPSKTLRSHERIQIYNQQYWWRFYHILQESFPFVLRMFGYGDFNALLVVPYLQKYPSRKWSITLLGENMVKWLQEDYKENDRKLVLKAAKLDWAYHRGFFVKSKPSLLSPDDLLGAKLRLQPHLFLMKSNDSFLKFRDAFLKEEVEYWLENDFPPLPKEEMHYFLIYRAPNGLMSWEEVTNTQYKLLSLFKRGSSIEDACSLLENDDSSYGEALQNIQSWFKHWSEQNLLYATK